MLVIPSDGSFLTHKFNYVIHCYCFKLVSFFSILTILCSSKTKYHHLNMLLIQNKNLLNKVVHHFFFKQTPSVIVEKTPTSSYHHQYFMALQCLTLPHFNMNSLKVCSYILSVNILNTMLQQCLCTQMYL